MKKSISLIAAFLVLGLGARAQSVEMAGRASVEADYKIMKGLHVTAEEEVRAGSSFASLGSLRTTIGLQYKPTSFLKLGAGYTLINPYSASAAGFKEPRHRFFVDATGYLPAGNFQFSLRERLQLTHRTGEFNVNQTTPNAMALKSRLGVKYKGWNTLVPGLYVEMRTALNDPWGHTETAKGTNKQGEEIEYQKFILDGYTHVYNDRYRLNLNCEIKFNRRHSLTPYLLVDFNGEYTIDTKSPDNARTPSQWVSAGYDDAILISPGLSYVFRF